MKLYRPLLFSLNGLAVARMQLPCRSWASHDGILYAVHFDAHDFASAALAATLIMHRLYRSKLQHTEYRIHLHRAWQPKHCAAHTVNSSL